MKRIVVFGLGAALFCGACRSTPVEITARFDAKAAEAALRPGSNTITGSAFIRRPADQLVTAAGEVVTLVPAKAYSDERFRSLFPDGKLNPVQAARSTDQTESDYTRLMRQTKADKSGNFSFADVRTGTWHIATRVIWSEPRESLLRGRAIYDKVEIGGEDNTVEVVISGN